MYKQFYGLNGEPFDKGIHPQHLFMYSGMNELISRFEYIKKHRGVMLITGESGTGKTTSIRYFLSMLSADLFFPIYLPLSTVGIIEFYKQLNDKLKGDLVRRKHELFKSIQQQILEYTTNRNKVPVIIIDEAHYLKNENFYELQIITNFSIDSLDPCIFIIVGQSHLRDRLSRSILRSFDQRISIKYSLTPLSPQLAIDYIKHGINLVGGKNNIFTDAAYKAIANISGGILRLLGKLTVKTLIYGANQKKYEMTEEDVLTASKEL